MNSPARDLLRIVNGAALLGFSIGGALAANEVMGAKHVREFQAGGASPFAERALAIVQRATIEGVGFALLAGFLGLLALLWTRRASWQGEASPSARMVGSFLHGSAAFALWAVIGAKYADDVFPFLGSGSLLLLNLVGLGACWFALACCSWAVRRMPFTPRDAPAAVALGSVIAVGLGGREALRLMRRAEDWQAPLSLAGVLLIVLLCFPVGGLIAILLRRPIGAISARFARGRILPRALNLGLCVALFACVLTTAATLELSATPAEVSYRQIQGRGEPEGPNVVLVTIDTLRADHLGCYGYERPTSPFIDSIAADGVRFADTSSSAAWTKPATGTILTGLYPSRHGALYHGSSLHLPEGEKTLAEVFRDAGYVTAGFVTNPNIKKVFEFDRGFDEFFDSPVEDTITLASIRGSVFGKALMRILRHQFNWKYENDVFQMNRHILAWLRENREQRFFLYLHYIDPHIPYSPPSPWREEFARPAGFSILNERKERVGIDLYDGEIRYSDEGMRQLVEEMQALDLWEDTLFVLTSDHGEEFFEHGVIGHGFSLYQGVIQIPLIFHGPDLPQGKVVEEPVQLVDMPATLLEAAGLEQDALGDGHSFASALHDPGWKSETPYFLENEFGADQHDNRDFVFSGVRMGPWKLVLTERNIFFPPEDHGAEALFNVAADPEENANLILEEEHRALIEELTDRLRAHSQFLLEEGFRDVKPTALSPEVQKNLEALGYL